MKSTLAVLATAVMVCAGVASCGGGAATTPAVRSTGGPTGTKSAYSYVRPALDPRRILTHIAGDHVELDTIAGIEQFPLDARVYKRGNRIYVAQHDRINSYTASGVHLVWMRKHGDRSESTPPARANARSASSLMTCADCAGGEIIDGPPSAGCDASKQSCPICPECSGPVPNFGDPAECLAPNSCGQDGGGSFVLRFGGPYGDDPNGAACSFSFTDDATFDCFSDLPEWLTQFITPNVAQSYIYYLARDVSVLTCGPASQSREYGGIVHYREVVTPNFTRVADQEFRNIPAGEGIEATFGPPAGPNSTVRGTFIAKLGTRIAANCNATGAQLAP